MFWSIICITFTFVQAEFFLVQSQLYGLSVYKRLERFAIERIFSRQISYARKSKKFCVYSPFLFFLVAFEIDARIEKKRARIGL